MKNYNLGFCECFGYPERIKDHFVEILDQIRCYLGSDHIRSVILFGSAARGELSYEINTNGQLNIFSDYEFTIVTKSHISKNQIKALREAIHNNKIRWGISNPLFHIEFMLNSTLKFIVKTPFLRRIGTYELFNQGITLFGCDLLNYQLGGVITSANLDYGNTNALILERLWWMLFYMPHNVILGQMTFFEEEIINYLTARSALEILAIFLPNEGVLLPGYKRRVSYFTNNYTKGSYFPHTFHEFIENCLDYKINLCPNDSFVKNYRNLLVGYLCLLNYLLSERKPSSLLVESLPILCEKLIQTDINLFPDPIYPTFRRLIKDYKVARHLSIPSPITWTFTEKRRHAVAFLLFAHGSLLRYLEKGTMPTEYLDKAEDLINWLTRKEHTDLGKTRGTYNFDNCTRWFELCKQFVHFVISWRVAQRPQEGKPWEVLQRSDW